MLFGSLHGLKRRGQNALRLLLADSEGEKRMLFGQADEADILVGGESRRQDRMLMWKMQCTAKPVAPRCDGRCSVLRWPVHRSASSAPRYRHVARSVAVISLQSRSRPLLTISNKIGMHLPGASRFILYSRPVPWRLASGRLAWYLCVAASPAGVGCGRFTSGIRPSR